MKEEILKRIEKAINFTRRNVPPDDIYLFTTEVIWTAYYIINEVCELDGFDDMIQEDERLHDAVLNILNFIQCEEENRDIQIKMKNYFSL